MKKIYKGALIAALLITMIATLFLPIFSIMDHEISLADFVYNVLQNTSNSLAELLQNQYTDYAIGVIILCVLFIAVLCLVIKIESITAYYIAIAWEIIQVVAFSIIYLAAKGEIADGGLIKGFVSNFIHLNVLWILVATAFHGPKPTKEHVVDHIDTNRRNNRADNLRWVTRLENALDNPITRKRIIMRCGSIEAFLANPSLLRESDVTPDFSWMRTVTDAEAQVSKERLLAWAESDKQASGGALGEWVYGRQSISQNDGQSSNIDEIDKLQSDSLNGWGQIPPRAYERPVEPGQRKPNVMLSLTPGAAQEIYFYNDKPNEYPCTPQEYSGDPLTAYAANLTENAVYWRNDNGDREYVVVKYGFSEDRNSLYVMTKSAYVWRSYSGGDSMPVPVANLNKDEFSENELEYQLGEVVYEDNLFVHKRVETGFMPKEYLEEIFAKCTKTSR